MKNISTYMNTLVSLQQLLLVKPDWLPLYAE